MPATILGPNQNVSVKFTSTKQGWVEIHVEASGPITIYVTTAAGKQAFMDQRPVVPTYAEAHDVEIFEQRVNLPPKTACLILLVNYDTGTELDDARAIYHRVTLGK